MNYNDIYLLDIQDYGSIIYICIRDMSTKNPWYMYDMNHQWDRDGSFNIPILPSGRLFLLGEIETPNMVLVSLDSITVTLW